MTAPIPPSSSPIPPPVAPLPPVMAPVVESMEAPLLQPTPTLGTVAPPPPDFTSEVLFAMMRSVETSTTAGRPHETLQVLSTLPAPMRLGEEASYFGGMALLQQGRVEDAAAIAAAGLQRTPNSVPLLLLAAAAQPAAPPPTPASHAQLPAAALPGSLLNIPVPDISVPGATVVLPSLPTVEAPVTPVAGAPVQPTVASPLSPSVPSPIAPGVQAPELPTVPLPALPLVDATVVAPPVLPSTPAQPTPLAPAPGVPIAPPSVAPAESARPAVNVAPLLAMGIPAPLADAPALAAPIALPMSPVIAFPPSRATPLLLQALDLAPRDLGIFARIAALLIGTRERPLMSALARELEASAPTNPAVRALATLLSGAAPPEWNPWARQVAARELWQGEAITPRLPLTATPPQLARVATELLASGEPAQALLLLELPAAPAHPQLAMLRAEALLQLQRPEAALAVIREAMVRFPEAERPLQVVAERLQAVLTQPLGNRDAKVTIPLLRALAAELGVTLPLDQPALTLTEAALPLLDPQSAIRSEVVMEARVRLLIAAGRGDLALLELRQARDLRPEFATFGRMLREVESGLSNAFPVRSHQEAAAMLAPLRERHAELPTFLSLALLERLVHSGEMPVLHDPLPHRGVSSVVDFRGPEGTAAGQWLAQFALRPTAASAGGAFFIVAIAVGFVLWIAGRTGMVVLWTVLCVMVAMVWGRIRRKQGDG